MKHQTKTAAIYLRVSTEDQTTENQLRELREVAERAGWEIVQVYEDVGISGAKGRDQRPAFDKLHKDAARRRFDMVLAWSVDRLGRSLKDLIELIEELHAVGCDLYLHQQGVDTTTPAGKAMFSMAGVFAEFERSMISERVKSGMARAKAQGKHVGRPSVPPIVIRKVVALRSEGLSLREIAGRVGLSHGKVGKVLRGQAAPA